MRVLDIFRLGTRTRFVLLVGTEAKLSRGRPINQSPLIDQHNSHDHVSHNMTGGGGGEEHRRGAQDVNHVTTIIHAITPETLTAAAPFRPPTVLQQTATAVWHAVCSKWMSSVHSKLPGTGIY